MSERSPDGARPGLKLWIERDGALLMSGFRVELLRRIGQAGSLAGAASSMGLSYRRAWGKLRELEQNLDTTLVESTVGGAGGGRSRLTAAATDLVAAYDAFSSGTVQSADSLFERYLRGLPGMGGAAATSGQRGQQVKVVADDTRGAPGDKL
jgi:molybdate transport system regulatory protein